MNKSDILILIWIILMLIVFIMFILGYIYFIKLDKIKNVDINYFYNKDKIMSFDSIHFIKDCIENPSNYSISISDNKTSAPIDEYDKEKVIDLFKNAKIKTKHNKEEFRIQYGIVFYNKSRHLRNRIEFLKDMVKVQNIYGSNKRDFYVIEGDYSIFFEELCKKYIKTENGE